MQGTPRSIGIIQPLILFFLIIVSRLSAKYLLEVMIIQTINLRIKKVLVYGAGNAGRQLVALLENNINYEIAGFVDDNEQLHRREFLGQIIYSPFELENIIKTKDISLVLLALPSIKSKEIKL